MNFLLDDGQDDLDMEELQIVGGDSLEVLIAAQAHVIHMLLLKDLNFVSRNPDFPAVTNNYFLTLFLS